MGVEESNPLSEGGISLVVLLCRLAVVLLLLLLVLLPLADLALVGLILVDFGKDKVEDFRIPGDRVAFEALLDVL